METLYRNDLLLVNELSSREYSGNTIVSRASQEEKDKLKEVKVKLKNIAEFFSQKYSADYGPFEKSVVTGNDIGMGGSKLKTMWSGIYKGSHKQYGAQISFVIDKDKPILHIGFYFGRANARQIKKTERQKLELQLDDLAYTLSESLKKNTQLRERYESLFELGFSAFTKEEKTNSNKWIDSIIHNASTSQIVIQISTGEYGYIDCKMIDTYVSQLMFLMVGVDVNEATPSKTSMTPEQRAKQAERLSMIGYKGELFVMEQEKKKLEDLGINRSGYPRHVSLESDSYGYDVLSLSKKGDELYIEVKTTTRAKDDIISNSFYLSAHEYKTYQENKNIYKIFRVFDLENNPYLEELSLDDLNLETSNYICTLK